MTIETVAPPRPSSSTSSTSSGATSLLPLSQLYIHNCSQRSLKPNSSLVNYFSQFDNAPSHLTELNLSLANYCGPQGFLPVVDTVVRINENSTSSSTPIANLKVLNASDNRISNESLEYLLSGLLDRFASVAFFRLFMTVGRRMTNDVSSAGINSSSAGNEQEVFEFTLDLSRNPISSQGGKKIVTFLNQIKTNNECGKNRVPVVFDTLNLENTLIVPSVLEQIEEQVSRLRLEVKFGEKLSDPKKELEEIEAADAEHKKKVEELAKKMDEERLEKLEEEKKKMIVNEQETKEIVTGEEKVVGISEETGEEIRGTDRGDCGGIDFASFGDNGKTESNETEREKENDDDDEEEEEEEGMPSCRTATSENNTTDYSSELTKKPSNTAERKFNGEKLKNVFVHKANNWKQALTDEHPTLSETHEVFVKPIVSNSNDSIQQQQQQPSSSASLRVGTGLPAMPLSAYPTDQRQTILSDIDNFKQYWVLKTKSEEECDEKERERRRTMWTGASTSNNTGGVGGNTGSGLKQTTKKAPRKKWDPPSDTTEEDSLNDEWDWKKKHAKKMPKKRAASGRQRPDDY